jgi:CheY-like chemotaxis protein
MEKNLLVGKNIIVADDEFDIREIIATELHFFGANVFEASNIFEVLELFKIRPIDIIISDIRMPGGTGIELLDKIKKIKTDLPIILITGFADITTEDALHMGAESLLSKPFKLDELMKVASRLISPVEIRFHEMIPANKSLKLTLPQGAFCLGRGGVVIEIEQKNILFEIGDDIKLDLILNNHYFVGVGICRWIKSVSESSVGLVGIEFISLEDSSLNFFKALMKNTFTIPFIPKTLC